MAVRRARVGQFQNIHGEMFIVIRCEEISRGAVDFRVVGDETDWDPVRVDLQGKSQDSLFDFTPEESEEIKKIIEPCLI